MRSLNGRLGTNVTGFNTTFRDSFANFPGSNWTQSVGNGDIVGVDGNAVGSSYLVISKNPLDTTGGETIVESNSYFSMPIEASAGIHFSQRTIGQEGSFEIVSTTESTTVPSELTITSISQAATSVLNVTTSTAHNLKVGSRIGIYGVLDSRLNYSQLVVATIVNTTSFTCTAGPGGTIPSTVTANGTQGFVYLRSGMAWNPNGTSMVFESAVATQASFYSKSNDGDMMLVGGTLAGSHVTTTASTASTQPAIGLANYNFRPTAEFRLALLTDRLQWHDVPVDSVTQTTARATVTQVVPNNNQKYKIRFRAKNQKGLTVPVAKIVSAAKSLSSTVTVITDAPHGLGTGDFVNIHGAKDTTNFPNLTTATVVASIVSPTSFTIVWGPSATATTYGGFVSRVNGGQAMQGASTQIVVSAAVVNNLLTLVGSATWVGTVFIGDYVNVHGVRNDTNGADVGVDGVYRVRDISTTTLILEPLDTDTTDALTTIGTLTTTACGGSIIKRTDMRISFVRLFDFNRIRIDTLNRPTNDIAGAMPVQVANIPSVILSSGTVTTVTAANLGPISTPTAGDVLTTSTPLPSAGSTVSSSAITASTGTEYSIIVAVSALGASNTFDVVVQESADAGTTWFDVYHFPRVSTTGTFVSPKIPQKGNRIRYNQTLSTGGTITRAISRLQGSFNGTGFVRRVFDRSLSLTATGSGTTYVYAQECNNHQLAIYTTTGAATGVTVQLEGSNDGGSTWFAIGSTLTGSATVGVVQQTVSNINAELVRPRVTVAGGTGLAGYLELKSWQ
jgi:hypothetical protein